jgi:hypothetical protein
MQNRRVAVRELAEEVWISTGSVHSILTDDLAMRRVSAKFVPKLLTMEERQLRLEVAQDMLDSANSDPDFLNIMSTGDESWVLNTQLKGTRFESRDDIIRNTTAKLYSIRKQAFQKCFEQCRKRWKQRRNEEVVWGGFNPPPPKFRSFTKSNRIVN